MTALRFNPQSYARMFANKSFGLLFSDIFLLHYQSLGVISVQDAEQWMSFIPKRSVEDTEREGKALYTNVTQFTEYLRGFETYTQEARVYFSDVLALPDLSTDAVHAFLKRAGDHFSFYSKTEFFYTNQVDEHAMVPSVKEFDALKLGGREFLNRIMFEEDGYIKSLLRRLESQTSISVEVLSFHTVDELIELVGDGKRIPESVLADRRQCFIMDGHTVYAGDAIKENVHALFSSYREESTVIEGTIANKGKVTGRARVLVPDFSDFDKIAQEVAQMQDGEILVAETTAPEIILACKKASAIVTNQGGMLSHAAIVSRELGIPCIIGTKKDVILNIKTGDTIEVDANQGIVRVIT